MTRYIKRPLPIEAVHFTRLEGEDWDDAWERLSDFTNEGVEWDVDEFTGEDSYSVYDYLHETWVRFFKEDWILKGIQGEFYPHNGALFPDVYEEYDE